jgi:RNA polymerase sporulation-specific sigma factor
LSAHDDDLLYWIHKYKFTRDELYLNRILKCLEPKIAMLPRRFYIKGTGHDPEEVMQESRIALVKAIEDFDENGGSSPENFLMMCIKRHIITKIMHAGRKKFKLHNEALSLEDPFITADEENGQTLADFVPDPAAPIDEKFLQELEFDENYKSLVSRLTPLERDVAQEYCNDGSYRDIAEKLDLKVKTVDNSIMRIKKKGQETYIDWLRAAEIRETPE